MTLLAWMRLFAIPFTGMTTSQAITVLPSELTSHLLHLAPAQVSGHDEGCVRFTVNVDEAGHVSSAVAGSGPESLREAERAAVLRTTYQPIPVGGNPVAVTSSVTRCALFEKTGRDVAADAIVLSSGVAMGQLLRKVTPSYPAEAKTRHVSGSVVVQMVIDPAGKVAYARVVSGPELLRANYLTAVKQWTYRPFLVSGQAVSVVTTVTTNIDFGA